MRLSTLEAGLLVWMLFSFALGYILGCRVTDNKWTSVAITSKSYFAK